MVIRLISRCVCCPKRCGMPLCGKQPQDSINYRCRNMAKSRQYAVAKVDELPVGSRKIVTVEDHSIGLFNVNGEIVAVLNLCPHEFAPVCLGRVSGTTEAAVP